MIESVQLSVGQAKTLRREIQSKGNERMEEEMQGKCQALRATKSLLQGDSSIETPMLIPPLIGFATWEEERGDLGSRILFLRVISPWVASLFRSMDIFISFLFS